jgi:hypothetical protein
VDAGFFCGNPAKFFGILKGGKKIAHSAVFYKFLRKNLEIIYLKSCNKLRNSAKFFPPFKKKLKVCRILAKFIPRFRYQKFCGISSKKSTFRLSG